MALGATHIRFALDLKDKYQVQNLEKYISGTIYPDSRYVTKIDRELTHNDDILMPEFAKNDFKKGWQVHQICDIAQRFTFRRQISFFDRHPKEGWEESRWVEFTSIKIIQDMADMQEFNIQEAIKYLKYTENPNGEDINEVKKYNQIIINLYKNKEITTIEDNYQMWLALGINDELGKKVKEKTKEFFKNEGLVIKIKSCYQKMLDTYENYL